MASEDRLYHNPVYSSQITGGWQRGAENIGWVSGANDLIARLHRVYMESAGHRDNVLGNYNAVGVGIEVTASGKLWSTVNFALLPALLAARPIQDAVGVSQREFAADTASWVVLARVGGQLRQLLTD